MLYFNYFLNKYADIQLFSFTRKTDLPKKYRDNCYSMFDLWYGNIRFVRYLLSSIHFFFRMVRYDDIAVIQDLDYFIPAYYAKKLKKNLVIIHYNTEIHGEDVHYPNHIVSFYEKHAGFPNLIIDCLKERAEFRSKKYCHQKVYYINNTIPLSDLQMIDDSDETYKKYLNFDNENPIICYAGGCDLSRGLGDIIDCIDEVKDKVNFVFFCHGVEKEKRNVVSACKKAIDQNVCHVYDAIPRTSLLNVLRHCHIGINYYDPNLSINHYYASPTKVFEYMGVGLNIISTNNEGINHIIEDNNIGVCIHDNESLTNAINRLLEKGLCPRDEVKKIFAEKYCYEKDSTRVIDEVIRLCRDN